MGYLEGSFSYIGVLFIVKFFKEIVCKFEIKNVYIYKI